MEFIWSYFLRVLGKLIRFLPSQKRYKWAGFLGKWVPFFFRNIRRSVDSNLGVINAWSGKSFKSQNVFENFSGTLTDFLTQSNVQLSVQGKEKADDIRAKGTGIIFLTSHLGNWELGGRLLSDWGWPVTAVYQPYRSVGMQNFIQNKRSVGLNYLAVGKGAAMGVSRALKKGESVALLMDRPYGEEGMTVRLCGKKTRWPKGPFVFASRFKVPLLLGFVLRQSPGVYRAIIEDPIWPKGSGEESSKSLVTQIVPIFEKYLSQYGDQWFCFDPVWQDN